MKIGILTYHRSVNDGSVLQAYCLQNLLNAAFPDGQVEIVDYRSVKREIGGVRPVIGRTFPFLNRDYVWRRRSLTEFRRNSMTLTSRHLLSDNCERSGAFITEQKYDALFVGSDTVWAIQEKSGKLRAPNTFFLPNVNCFRGAFAVSADQTNRELLNDPKLRATLKSLIERFSYVSYRDTYTAEILEMILGESAQTRLEFVADPTIICDFSSIVSETEASARFENESWAGVAIADPVLRKVAAYELKSMGYKVINLLGTIVEGQDRGLGFLKLGERLGVFKSLKALITDRFHGSIFALKLTDSPVVFVERPTVYPDQISKGRDLFCRLGIEDMVVRWTADGLKDGWFRERAASWDSLRPVKSEKLGGLRSRGMDSLGKMQEMVIASEETLH